MRHMEQTRRVAVDNHIPHFSLAADPRTGSACASSRTYQQYAIHSLLLPSVTPRLESSATLPSHDQLCSTSSHHRCWPPAGHTAASPPRLPTNLTGAPFRSTTVYTSALPQSQPSSRFPSHLLIACHPLHPSSQQARSSSPIPYKVLLFCIPISSRTGFVVSQLPLLQISVQASWARFVHLLCNTFNPLAVSGLRVLSPLLPERYPLSHPPELPPHLRAACRVSPSGHLPA
jgi:hypothetical protein